MITLFPERSSQPEYIDKTAEYNGRHLLSAIGTPSGKKETTESLVRLMMAIQEPALQRAILGRLGISQLVGVVLGLVRMGNRFLELTQLDEGTKGLYTVALEVLSRFPIVKLVDGPSAFHTGGHRAKIMPSMFLGFSAVKTEQEQDQDSDQTRDSLGAADIDASIDDSGADLDAEEVRPESDQYDDDDDIVSDPASDRYQLDVMSPAFDMFMSYLSQAETIRFPLVEIKTAHLEKVTELIGRFAVAVKVSNGWLPTLGSAAFSLQNLRVLTLADYTNYEAVLRCHTFQKLIVYGNEVSSESVGQIMQANPQLAEIYYKGRLLQPDVILHKAARTSGDFIILQEGVDWSQLDHCIVYGLTVLAVEEDVASRVKNMQQVRDLRHLSLHFASKTEFVLPPAPALENLTLSNCTLNNESLAFLESLVKVQFVECEVSSSVLCTLADVAALRHVELENCDIIWDAVLGMPANLKQLTLLDTRDVSRCKDLVLLSYSTRATQFESGADMDRIIRLNINEERMCCRVESSNRLAVWSAGQNRPAISLASLAELASLSIASYPNFTSVDFANLPSFSSTSGTIDITLYAYGNVWHKPVNLPGSDGKIEYRMRYVNVNRIGKAINGVEARSGMEDSDTEDEDAELGRHKRGQGRGLSGSHHAIKSRIRGRPPNRIPGSSTIPESEVRIADGKFVDTNPEDLTVFQQGYQGRRLPFPVARHTAPPMARPDDPTKPYQCRFCKRSFDRRENFRRHSLIHTDYRPYVCPKCKKGFKRSDNLRSHMRVCHNTVPPRRKRGSKEPLPPDFEAAMMEAEAQQMEAAAAEAAAANAASPSEASPALSAETAAAIAAAASSSAPSPGPGSAPLFGTRKRRTSQECEQEAQRTSKRLKFNSALSSFRFEPSKLRFMPGRATLMTPPTTSQPVRVPTISASSPLLHQQFQSQSRQQQQGRQSQLQSSSAGSTVGQLMPVVSRTHNPQNQNMGVFRMEKPGEIIARSKRQQSEGMILNPPADSSVDENTITSINPTVSPSSNPSSGNPNETVGSSANSSANATPSPATSMMASMTLPFQNPGSSFALTPGVFASLENRRDLIRERVNEAFKRCVVDVDGHYVCYKCGKNFAKRGNIKRHLILHLDLDMYGCVCGRTFQRSDNYKTHFTKCKRRLELGLPVTLDAEDMQVPRRGQRPFGEVLQMQGAAGVILNPRDSPVSVSSPTTPVSAEPEIKPIPQVPVVSSETPLASESPAAPTVAVVPGTAPVAPVTPAAPVVSPMAASVTETTLNADTDIYGSGPDTVPASPQ